MYTPDGFKKQFEESLQIYFDRCDIKEKANVSTELQGMGRLLIKVHTEKLLGYEDLTFIDRLAYMLAPIGIMHEVVNASICGDKEQQILTNAMNFEIAMIPGKNESIFDTSTDVTMPVSKTDKKDEKRI